MYIKRYIYIVFCYANNNHTLKQQCSGIISNIYLYLINLTQTTLSCKNYLWHPLLFCAITTITLSNGHIRKLEEWIWRNIVTYNTTKNTVKNNNLTCNFQRPLFQNSLFRLCSFLQLNSSILLLTLKKNQETHLCGSLQYRPCRKKPSWAEPCERKLPSVEPAALWGLAELVGSFHL